MGKLFAFSRRLEDSTHLDLLLWPEAAIPDYFVNRPDWDSAIAQRVRETRTPLLTGGLDVEFRTRESYEDRKSTRLNSSHGYISYAVFCLKKKKKTPKKWQRRKS